MKMFKSTERICLYLSALTLLVLGACKDPYYYDDREPEWLGSSIYNYLVEQGDFTYFTRIIDSCNYTEVLSRTGSKTMFVCHDDAFETFFKDNDLGIEKFEDFTRSQLNQIMEYAMVNDANLIEMMSMATGYVVGQVMRRPTALDPLDMMTFEKGDQLADNSKYFNMRKDKGMFLLNDNTSPYLVQFFDAQMKEKGITNEDFRILFNGTERQDGDVHIFDNKVIERDITCKNGYIHVLEKLQLPGMNMAEYIRQTEKVSKFNRLLDRFSIASYQAARTNTYKTLHPEFTDSIFSRRYTATEMDTRDLDLGDNVMYSDEMLLLDPGYNAYDYQGNGRYDMAAMFVPTNQAMDDYFSPTGEGSFLHERFQVWDSVPNDLVRLIINANMKYSFLATLPSKFNGIKNEYGDEIGAQKADINEVKVGTNGVVYVTDKVYPPVELASVMAPVMVHKNTQLFRAALEALNFDIYLKSMVCAEPGSTVPPYTFLVPYDYSINDYIYPPSWGHSQPIVYAVENRIAGTPDIYGYALDVTTGKRITNTPVRAGAFSEAYLKDIMDYHIVVADVEAGVLQGQEYFETKGKGFIRVQQDGYLDNGMPRLVFYGGGNMEQNKKWSPSKTWNDTAYAAVSTRRLHFKNGNTYFISKDLQQPLTSVYKTLKDNAAFNKVFTAMQGPASTDDKTNALMLSYYGKEAIFSQDDDYVGFDWNVDFFSSFHYTLYAPNNTAMDKAYAAGLPTWDAIETAAKNAITADDRTLLSAQIAKLVRFLKYHFQDNSVFIKGKPLSGEYLGTAAANTISKKFHQVKVTQDLEKIRIIPCVSDADGNETFNESRAVEVKTDGLYNLMARDYYFKDAGKNGITGVNGTTSDYSSRTVIHELSDYLNVINVPAFASAKFARFDNEKNAIVVEGVLSDNGDGVAYNNSIVIERGLCWDFKSDPDINDSCVAMTSLTEDVGSFREFLTIPTSTNPSDTLVYIKAYAVNQWTSDGEITSDRKEGLCGYSREICIDIKNRKKVY